MAEQTVNSVVSAVTGELAGRAFSGLMGRFGTQAATDEKLQRLEMLLIMIHSAVEASEKHTIKNARLVQWRDKLKDAASEGDQVLASFRQRAMDPQASPQQQGSSSSSSSTTAAASTGTALSFTRNALSGMVQGIRSATKMLLSWSDEDTKKLNAAVDKLKKVSRNIRIFIKLFQLEVKEELRATEKMTKITREDNFQPDIVPEETPRDAKRARPDSCKAHIQVGFQRKGLILVRPNSRKAEVSAPCMTFEGQRRMTFERQRRMLVVRLERALASIREAVEQADGRDFKDLEWLAHWADILREAKKQGSAVLGAAVSGKAGEESMVEGVQEDGELSRFVRSMESLAWDVEYFIAFVSLSPSN